MTSTVRETLREAVLDAGRKLGIPDPVTQAFVRHLRPCVHLCAHDMVPERQRPGAGPVGRAAGPARLPKDLEAPDGLPHILTLDCAAIPADALDIELPADGHLVVFAEITDYPGEGAVIHLPPGAAEHTLREVEGTAGPDFHDPFPLYAVPGATLPDFQRWSDLAEAAEYAGEDAERRRLVERLIGEIDAILYPRWTYDIQLGGHSRAWQNPVEDRGHVLLLRVPESAVSDGDGYLTLIAGRREQLAEHRYEELEFEVEC
ncbi:hypothetical protein ACFV9W_07355 [Streptomyces sp. NPDC059897]|uniref:hypothetical protein n=1 Tax=Streptomyces sp. NPDC059897 TaxID=3346994 RepID=UPI00364E084D